MIPVFFFFLKIIKHLLYLRPSKQKNMQKTYKKIWTSILVISTTVLTAQIPMAWAERYNAPPDMQDEARSIQVDTSGNVFVTGSGFNSSGNLDMITVKYDEDGNQMWVRNYDRGVNDNDEGKMLVLDDSGNVYVTGYSRGSTTSLDIIVIKYDNAGNQQWTSFYNGTSNGIDEGKSIAVDGSGNVFVCGYSSDSLFFYDAITLMFNSNGVQQWVQTYDGAASGNDELLELVIDASSNVYVVGNTEATTSNYDFLTIKYNSAGTQQWLQTYNGPSGSGDYGKGITLDNNNNVVVTGQSFQTNQWFDYLTIKYSNSGTQQWTARYNNASNRYEDAWDVITDNSGYVYITGQSQAVGNNSTPPDCATVKYTPAGNQVWVKRFDGGFGNLDDRAFAIALDDTANVYISGYSSNASNYDCITIKYDSAGTEEWNLRFNSVYNQNDQSLAMTVKNGDVYITGKSTNAVNEDFLTIRYSYSAVGILETTSSFGSLLAYPVPSNNTVIIDFPQLQGTAESIITLTDVNGRIVMTTPVGQGVKSILLDLTQLTSGCYTISQLNQEGELIARQLMIKD